jgi:hypothetical protein
VAIDDDTTTDAITYEEREDQGALAPDFRETGGRRETP